MEYIEVFLKEVVEEKTSNDCHTIILENEDATIRIPIIIDSYDAEAIISVLEDEKESRPHTHELLVNFANLTGYLVRKVEITDFEKGVFSATITFGNTGADNLRLDSRPSDAITIALKTGCRMFVAEKVVERVGVLMGSSHEEATPFQKIIAMEKRLSELVENELYEEAAKLRDVINAYKSSKDPVS